MAFESALWQRVRKAGVRLRALLHGVHMCRIENSAGDGNPDVEACIDGALFSAELKSEDRPKRATTPIRFKVRESQSIWHRERCAAGCRHNWILAQVGEAHEARLYLIPGKFYDEIVTTEDKLAEMSVLLSPNEKLDEILMQARLGY
jgi:hypothetical protein